MIAGISVGKSFSHCISYCLEDKRSLSEEQKLKKSLEDGLQHKGRAEVLAYNMCFGNKQELAQQFQEVRKLSRRVEKPVLHLSLRLAPGEHLDQSQLIAIAEEMVKEMGVASNQYFVVEHKDTPEQHIHIVANRVGYDGKAASTSNNFYKMDKLCRRLEKQYQIKEVLSPKQFLPREMQGIPRHDSRKERMKADVKQALQSAKTYEAFARLLEKAGYSIIKGRGITFIDDKKVKVKGSELGYSLATIEKILQRKQSKNLQHEQGAGNIKPTRPYNQTDNKPTPAQTSKSGLPKKPLQQSHSPNIQQPHPGTSAGDHFSLLDILLSPTSGGTYVPAEPPHPKKKKKKRKRRL